jgi:hypothetical protein
MSEVTGGAVDAQVVDAAETSATSAPAAQIQPAAKPKVAAADVRSMPADEFNKRLAQAEAAGEKKALAALGVERPDDLKARLARLKELEDAQLSDKERTEKKLAELQALAEASKTVSTVAEDAVKELYDALPEHIRLAVDELKPKNAEERLKYVRAFRKAGLTVAPSSAAPITQEVSAPAATTQQTAPPAPAAPANSGVAPGAPKPATRTKLDEYRELSAKNPIAAGVFYQANKAAIEAARPTS